MNPRLHGVRAAKPVCAGWDAKVGERYILVHKNVWAIFRVRRTTLVIKDAALLVLACALMLAANVSLIAYALFAVRRPGHMQAAIALFFAFGWIIILIPFGAFYLYSPPWNAPFPSMHESAKADLWSITGYLLIVVSLGIDLWRVITQKRSRLQPKSESTSARGL